MGRDVPAITVSQQDRRRYREKVRQCLDVLARMLRDSWFETSTRQVGLEVEVNLVDDSGTASMRSPDVLDAIGDPSWAPELGRFNIEVNIPPRPLCGDALDQMEAATAGQPEARETRGPGTSAAGRPWSASCPACSRPT